jgi:hypothetical protein
MFHYVNDSKLGSHVKVAPANRAAILARTKIFNKPKKRKFFIENFTQTPDFNAATYIYKDKYTPNMDDEIYLPYKKDVELILTPCHETDWGTFINYR